MGGRGNAGLGKTKRIYMLKNDRYHFGHYGFKRPQCAVHANSTINVNELEAQLDRYVSLGFASKDGDTYNVDLTEAGIDKLLGTGNVGVKVNVTVAQVSVQAREKIVAAGGSIVGCDDADESVEE